VSHPTATIKLTNKGKQMTELQIEIATELSAMGTTLDGAAFWAEVDRLATFGDEWWDEV
jgi:hypothetical protein